MIKTNEMEDYIFGYLESNQNTEITRAQLINHVRGNMSVSISDVNRLLFRILNKEELGIFQVRQGVYIYKPSSLTDESLDDRLLNIISSLFMKLRVEIHSKTVTDMLTSGSTDIDFQKYINLLDYEEKLKGLVR